MIILINSINLLKYQMSSPSCRPPLCTFNCCDQMGLCPTSSSGCYNQTTKNPIWLYLIIGIVIISIIAGAIIFLIIFRKRRQRIAQKSTKQTNSSNKQIPQLVEIQMKEREQPSPTIPIKKKNIYVYQRQVKQKEELKPTNDIRSVSSSISRKGSDKSRSVQNRSDTKSRIRNQLL